MSINSHFVILSCLLFLFPLKISLSLFFFSSLCIFYRSSPIFSTLCSSNLLIIPLILNGSRCKILMKSSNNDTDIKLLTKSLLTWIISYQSYYLFIIGLKLCLVKREREKVYNVVKVRDNLRFKGFFINKKKNGQLII